MGTDSATSNPSATPAGRKGRKRQGNGAKETEGARLLRETMYLIEKHERDVEVQFPRTDHCILRDSTGELHSADDLPACMRDFLFSFCEARNK
jgi:hypothetical protein